MRIYFTLFATLLILSSLVGKSDFSEMEIEEKLYIVAENEQGIVQAALDLGRHFYEKREFGQAAKYYRIAGKESSKSKEASTELFLSAIRGLTFFYFKMKNTDSLEYNVNIILENTKDKTDSLNLAYRGEAYSFRGANYFYNLREYDKAYENLRRAGEIAKQIGDAALYQSAYYDICNLIYGLEPEKLLETVAEVEKTAATFKDNTVSFASIQKYRAIYISENSTDSVERAKALAFYQKLIRDYEKAGRKSMQVSNTTEMISFFREELGKDSVMQYSTFCYNYMRAQDRVLPNTARVYSDYGVSLFNVNRYQECIDILEETIPLLTIGEYNYPALAKIYEYLFRAQSALANQEEAIKYFDLFKEVGIKNQEIAVENVVSKLEVEYDIDKSEKENQVLQAENNLIQTRNNYLMIVGGLLIGLLLTGLYFFRKINENKKELERINEGKNQLFAVLAHDLKGPAGAFSNLILLCHSKNH